MRRLRNVQRPEARPVAATAAPTLRPEQGPHAPPWQRLADPVAHGCAREPTAIAGRRQASSGDPLQRRHGCGNTRVLPATALAQGWSSRIGLEPGWQLSPCRDHTKPAVLHPAATQSAPQRPGLSHALATARQPQDRADDADPSASKPTGRRWGCCSAGQPRSRCSLVGWGASPWPGSSHGCGLRQQPAIRTTAARGDRLHMQERGAIPTGWARGLRLSMANAPVARRRPGDGQPPEAGAMDRGRSPNDRL
jgi:hypothetical protein